MRRKGKPEEQVFERFSERFGTRTPRAERFESETQPEPPEPSPPPKPEPGTWAHRTLGVCPDATPREISAAYRRLARAHHPDVAGDEEKMKEINIAYAELRR